MAVPALFIDGAGPDAITQEVANNSRLVSITSDAVRQSPQRRPAATVTADVHSPQSFPARSLGLADASVGIVPLSSPSRRPAGPPAPGANR
jgi:hypothetical protein